MFELLVFPVLAIPVGVVMSLAWWRARAGG